MSKVSIIGAGPAGLIFAYALLQKGYEVTVYSDRTPDQWLNHSAPTGTAFLYGEVIDIERELGMDYWSDTMHAGSGVLMDFKPEINGDARMVLGGSFGRNGGAIDQRMRVHRWLNDLESKGGKLVIESVTPERLDAIAAASDLTVLSAGKADLGRCIDRDPDRSVYDRPQRNLSMAICRGVDDFRDRIDLTPVKFNFYGDSGELFWVPYTHKTAGKTWCLLVEAKPNGPLDKFGDCRSGQDVTAVAKELIRQHAPWEWDMLQNMDYVEEDPHGWLTGRFPPTVRKAYGRLPSGGLVMPLGDTAVTFDPIGGQGGNHASRHARYCADRIIEHGDQPFDESWMSAITERWWTEYASWAYNFNNLLLEPLNEASGMVMEKSAQDRGFADQHLFGNFPIPRNFFPLMFDTRAARGAIDAWDKVAA